MKTFTGIMKIFNAKVAIYCDVPIEVPDDFDYKNYNADELIAKAFDKTLEFYDLNTEHFKDSVEIEVSSILDDTDTCLIIMN